MESSGVCVCACVWQKQVIHVEQATVLCWLSVNSGLTHPHIWKQTNTHAQFRLLRSVASEKHL